MDSIFVIDEGSNNNFSGNGGKASFPDYPGENPTKSVIIAWCDTWQDDLTGIGCSAPLRGELPHEIKKLVDRRLLPVPADAALAVSVTNENARITDLNAANEIERQDKLREIQNRVAGKLKRALRPKAPLLLKALLTKYQHRVSAAADADLVDESYDGIAMFKAIKAKSKEAVDRNDQLKYTKAMEKIRDNKLADNVTGFADRVNLAVQLQDQPVPRGAVHRRLAILIHTRVPPRFAEHRQARTQA